MIYIAISVIVLVISIIIYIYSSKNLKEANKLKVIVYNNQEEYNQQYNTLVDNIIVAKEQLLQIQNNINQARIQLQQEQNRTNSLEIDYEQQKNKYLNELFNFKTKEKDKINNDINSIKSYAYSALQNYMQCLDQAYNSAEINYDNKIQSLIKDEQKAQEELNSIKKSLTAAINTQLREQEKKDNTIFYTLQVDPKNLYEIDIIKKIESQLSDPRPVRMLIWTTYYSKKANDLCNRVLGKDKVCGIYKITNTLNNMCYIGQAVDMKERWREHMKCGLGIDTPAGNKLYAAMQEFGLESFTFEKVMDCSQEELNSQEAFFIDLYSAYEFGYNSNKGHK